MSDEEFFKFLKQRKANLDSILDSSTVIVVMGNETCDLDSAVCSIVYSWILSKYETVFDLEKFSVLPVLNTKRAEFNSRPEVKFLLEKNHISSDMLVFRDDIDLHKLYSQFKLKLVLVDHHTLKNDDVVLTDSVIEILDHRPCETLWKTCDSQFILSNVGSCSTLVALGIFKLPHLNNFNTANLLYGTILFDTVCLSKSAGRATKLDHYVVNTLEEHFEFSDGRETLFQQICDARNNSRNLDSLSILMRDLKFAKMIPVPVIPLLFQDFIQRSDAVSVLQEFCKLKGSSIIVAMGYEILKDNIRRDLAVYTTCYHEQGVIILNHLKNSKSPDLELQDVSHDIKGLLLCDQKNPRITRKLLLPLITEVVSQI